MINKTISITLKACFPQYEIIKMKNAAIVDWTPKMKLRIGDYLTETEANEIARCKVFDVTIVK